MYSNPAVRKLGVGTPVGVTRFELGLTLQWFIEWNCILFYYIYYFVEPVPYFLKLYYIMYGNRTNVLLLYKNVILSITSKRVTHTVLIENEIDGFSLVTVNLMFNVIRFIDILFQYSLTTFLTVTLFLRYTIDNRTTLLYCIILLYRYDVIKYIFWIVIWSIYFTQRGKKFASK